MIRHMVLVRFGADTADADIARMFEQLDRLRDVLPGMVAFAGGGNVSPEGLSRGYTHAFTCDFETLAARDAYLIHPAHQAAGARLVSMAEGGLDGVLVLDFDIPAG